MNVNSIPVVVEFVRGSRIHREAFQSAFVELPSGRRLAVPADQLVLGEDGHGSARLGFGGMSFEGTECEGTGDEKLVFWRVRDLLPEHLVEISEQHDKVLLDSAAVASVTVQGTRVWPRH